MTLFKTLSAAGIAAVIMCAPNAFAAEAAERPESMMTKSENTQVLAAIETADMIPVQDEDGNIFYNHYVAASELLDVSADFETVDTYTYEYNGRLYTNKIVTE